MKRIGRLKKMLIRPFHPDDVDALRAVFVSSVHGLTAGEYSAEQRAAWAPTDYDHAAWAERMLAMQPLVGERDGRIVGYAGLLLSGYIDHFYVAAEAARCGIGSALMQRIHELAAERAMESLFSDVSLTARPFFERWSFTVERPQTVVVRGVEFVNFRMRHVMPSRPAPCGASRPFAQ